MMKHMKRGDAGTCGGGWCAFICVSGRNKIQTGYLLVALNGIEMKELNPERFRPVTKKLEETVCIIWLVFSPFTSNHLDLSCSPVQCAGRYWKRGLCARFSAKESSWPGRFSPMVQPGASPIVKICKDQKCAWPNAEVCVFRFRRVRQVRLSMTNQNSLATYWHRIDTVLTPYWPYWPYSAAQEKEKIVKEVVKQENAVTALQAQVRSSEQQCAACCSMPSGSDPNLALRWAKSQETVACSCHAESSSGIQRAATPAKKGI